VDVVLAVAVALLVDRLAGDPPSAVHPVAWLGRLIDAGRRALGTGPPPRLLAAGALVVALVTGLAWAAGVLVSSLAARAGAPGIVLEGLALSLAISLRGLAEAADRVGRALAAGDLDAARAAVGRDLVSRPTADLDAGEVAAAAIESVAENLTDAVLAPLAFYLLLGLPGAFAYRAVNTADAMLGYRDGALEHFGKAAARLDDLLNLAPARLGGLALVAGAALAGGDARGAWRTMRRDACLTASPNAGWTMAAMAGALGVRLVKRGAYRLGDGPLPAPAHLAASVGVLHAAAGVGVLALLAARLAVEGR
jgi:adenosylcobinamide-phosphate synthase